MEDILTLKQLKNALQYKNVHLVRTFVDETPNANIADIIEQLTPYERIFFFRIINPKDSGEIFSYLESEIQESIISAFTNEELEAILDDLYLDDIVDMIGEMPDNIAKKILQNVKNTEDRAKINKLLKYNEDVVGSVMSVEFIRLNENISCSKAIEEIRKKREESELVHYYIVLDDENKLQGVTTLENIVFVNSRKNTKIFEVTEAIASVSVNDKKETAARIFAEQDMSILPVVNEKNYVIGIITSDDVIDVLEEEATEDIYKMAGINSEVEISYHDTSIVKKIVKSRIFWLIILMVGSTLSQLIIQLFQDKVDASPYFLSAAVSSAIVVSMVPVISGTAGNAGSQAATIVTRAIALGEVKNSRWRIIGIEMKSGLIIASILFIINFVRLVLYFTATGDLIHDASHSEKIEAAKRLIEAKGEIATQANIDLYIQEHVVSRQVGITMMCLVSSFAMFIAVVFAKCVGSVVPLLAAKLKKDPAVMSSPILATVTDATSTIIFFSFAMLFFWMLNIVH
ncbi:magnesium transporter [[Mycoplasma] gypis]|uniref:Magnesium transporter MgtE n=1 Tax=[Mycoplasma] gypis TaxID=92404 RepID=A0ABZ2RRE2_9BACT